MRALVEASKVCFRKARKVFKALLLSRQTGKQGVVSLVLLAILFKPLGLLREILVAHFFGASSEVDALEIVRTLYALLSGFVITALPATGIPILVEQERKRGRAARDEVYSRFLILGGFFALGIALLALIGSPIFLRILAPGLEPSVRALAGGLVILMSVSYTHLTLPTTERV